MFSKKLQEAIFDLGVFFRLDGGFVIELLVVRLIARLAGDNWEWRGCEMHTFCRPYSAEIEHILWLPNGYWLADQGHDLHSYFFWERSIALSLLDQDSFISTATWDK